MSNNCILGSKKVAVVLPLLVLLLVRPPIISLSTTPIVQHVLQKDNWDTPKKAEKWKQLMPQNALLSLSHLNYKQKSSSYIEDFDRQITLPPFYSYNIPPRVVDLHKDGVLETIIATERKNQTTGSLVLLFRNQKIVSGWPVELGWEVQGILGTFFDPMEQKEAILFYTTVWNGTHISTILFALDESGSMLPSYHISIADFSPSGELFADLDKDSIPEIIMNDVNGTILFFDIDGTPKPNWPKHLNATLFSQPVSEDLNNDGIKDIIICTDTGEIYAWNQNGSMLAGYPLQIPRKYPSVNEGFREMPVIADFNNDTYFDLFVGSTIGYLYGISLNPNLNETWIYELETSIYKTSQAIAYDINQDGVDELIQPTYSGVTCVRIINETLTNVFDYTSALHLVGTPAIADVNRDNKPEIILNDLGSLLIFSSNGTLLSSLTKVSSSSEFQSPLIYDFDNDKEVEIIYLSKFGVLYVFETNDFGFMSWVDPFMSAYHTINVDKDHDGLWDLEEDLLGTNVELIDSDFDGISDGQEVNQYVLNPIIADKSNDTDSDLLSNVDEVDLYHTHPLNPDTDFDYVSDGDEVLTYHTNPLSQDTDNDGMTDTFEITYYSVLDPNDPSDANKDADSDNLLNRNEQSWGTDPTNPDSDGDGLLDGDEVYKYITDPLIPDADADYDGDGISNVDEVDTYGTNPTNPDTDGDGATDYEEIHAGSDPLDLNSLPKTKKNYWLISLISIPALVGVIVLIMKKIKR
ncbi:MAG: FG-GAP-like repeat-containing protein [Candidatus Heimdallarchaeaceae archaeon]